MKAYSEKEILRMRIAAMKLYGSIPNIRIEIIGSDYWDLLITFINENLKFAVKVGGSTFISSNSYNEYVDFLREQYASTAKIPIIVACVNESTEEASIGFILRWKFNQVVLYSKPGLAVLTPRTSTILKDNVMSMDNTIRVLDNNNLCVKKHMVISDVFPRFPYCDIHLIYLRKFSEYYRMKEVRISSDLERFHRYQQDIPQNEYPEDEFDNYLKNSVQEKWSDASIRIMNSQFILNVDLRELHDNLSNYPSQSKLNFLIEPAIDEMVIPAEHVFQAYKWNFMLYYSQDIDKSLLCEDMIICRIPMNNWKTFCSKIMYFRQSVIDDLSIRLM